ncbi:hypothetical protein ZIOFF_033653 [Zingiber officinale]|uniref:Uncharacterized protein n=1 Tax=Zingiber officinale TaxID=94328 RepID=A0A8J5L1Y1_ZINOF|nr:hypothetical protein ZIOFF_033653 [Zingiber officinale]
MTSDEEKAKENQRKADDEKANGLLPLGMAEELVEQGMLDIAALASTLIKKSTAMLLASCNNLNRFCDLLNESNGMHQRNSISEDTWQQLLAFSQCVNEDLEGYDPNGAWPILIDNFVQHMYRIEFAFRLQEEIKIFRGFYKNWTSDGFVLPLVKYNGSARKPSLSGFCSNIKLYAMLVDNQNKKTLLRDQAPGRGIKKKMGRPPCCDKDGVKKGPWTPEEDILLVSYIQQHGPGNWRAVPTNTGLLRCSKSCRLRWTNYLRPGIKRGNFTDQEERLIIHLQALLGNRWATIASYLPERTDNDVKNYWNTHLKKRLENKLAGGHDSVLAHHPTPKSKGQWEMCVQADPQLAKRALSEALSEKNSSSDAANNYAASAKNIARLLEGWMKSNNSSSNNAMLNSGLPNSALLSQISASSTSNYLASLESLGSFGLEDQATSVQEGSPGTAHTPPLELLKSWLLDANVGDEEHQESFLSIVMDQTN